jgi:hypothetical protein
MNKEKNQRNELLDRARKTRFWDINPELEEVAKGLLLEFDDLTAQEQRLSDRFEKQDRRMRNHAKGKATVGEQRKMLANINATIKQGRKVSIRLKEIEDTFVGMLQDYEAAKAN